MNDVIATETLMLRAKRLASLARAKRDDEGASQDQSQTQTALNKLDAELTGFASALVVHRALTAAHVPVATPTELEKPAKALRDRVASQGRPTAQYLNARVREVAGIRAQIAQSDQAAWREWAETQLRALPLALLPRLGPNQAQVKERIRKLQLSAAAAPTKSDIALFRLNLDHVQDILADIEESGDLNALLARFSAHRGRLPLSDVTDEEVALIRNEPSLAEQIFLSTS
ncbi:hypothetical protein M6D93_15190 [Jatrophihabitans telluris]|uniref:DUF222 domain-containing protein n=1 Tax=Jatrophihabitans telluris TaxID=2038343 RepID=A0ABY4QVP5_9ACTN|nr:hypothetical protein [Jatrophihabitans telluris]UQX87635.1 hypothetical protein M6D93_15190 [Jatrophihabitans telluris]